MHVLILLAAAASGAALLGWVDVQAPLLLRLLCGAPVGLTLLALVGYGLASAFGLTPAVVWTAAAVVIALALTAPRGRLTRSAGASWAVVLLAGALLPFVFSRAAYLEPDGLYTGDAHNLGDLPFHLAIVTGFVHGENIPPEHPELSGARLTYPFLADFLAAMLVRAGASLTDAFLLESLVLALAVVGLLHHLAGRLTGDGNAAVLSPPLALLSGGLGFVGVLREAGLFGLLRLPHDATITPQPPTGDGAYRWGNALVTLLIPQRSLLLGIPLALVVFWLWWEALETQDPARRRRLMLAAGLVTGLTPLAHAHGFAVLLGLAAVLAVSFRPVRDWVPFFAAALAVGMPQAAWLAHGSSLQAGSFVAFEPGWDHGEHNPLGFWLKNTGAFLPLLGVALYRLRGTRLVRFFLPFLLLFAVPNLLRLSPWIWDNVKFLYFWYLGSVPLVALMLARLGRRGRVGLAAAVLLFVSLTLAGALDVWRIASRQVRLRIFDSEGMAFAARVIETTPPRALLLHAPSYDSPVYLTGRRSLLGYPGHIWSQGLDAGSRGEEIQAIYAGAADASALLSRHGIDFVVVGPQERASLVIDEAFLAGFPVVAVVGGARLLRVR